MTESQPDDLAELKRRCVSDRVAELVAAEIERIARERTTRALGRMSFACPPRDGTRPLAPAWILVVCAAGSWSALPWVFETEAEALKHASGKRRRVYQAITVVKLEATT